MLKKEIEAHNKQLVTENLQFAALNRRLTNMLADAEATIIDFNEDLENRHQQIADLTERGRELNEHNSKLLRERNNRAALEYEFFSLMNTINNMMRESETNDIRYSLGAINRLLK